MSGESSDDTERWVRFADKADQYDRYDPRGFLWAHLAALQIVYDDYVGMDTDHDGGEA